MRFSLPRRIHLFGVYSAVFRCLFGICSVMLKAVALTDGYSVDSEFRNILDRLPEKPPRSRLEPYGELIDGLRCNGEACSGRGIVRKLFRNVRFRSACFRLAGREQIPLDSRPTSDYQALLDETTEGDANHEGEDDGSDDLTM
jgi:hypothetical protein